MSVFCPSLTMGRFLLVVACLLLAVASAVPLAGRQHAADAGQACRHACKQRAPAEVKQCFKTCWMSFFKNSAVRAAAAKHAPVLEKKKTAKSVPIAPVKRVAKKKPVAGTKSVKKNVLAPLKAHQAHKTSKPPTPHKTIKAKPQRK